MHPQRKGCSYDWTLTKQGGSLQTGCRAHPPWFLPQARCLFLCPQRNSNLFVFCSNIACCLRGGHTGVFGVYKLESQALPCRPRSSTQPSSWHFVRHCPRWSCTRTSMGALGTPLSGMRLSRFYLEFLGCPCHDTSMAVLVMPP